MRWAARLQSAQRWLCSYGGRNIVRGYARWFGVDQLCAVKELRLLGIAVSEEYERQLRLAAEARARRRRESRARRAALDSGEDGEIPYCREEAETSRDQDEWESRP